MKLAEEQEIAFDKIVAWLSPDNTERFFSVCGYAGTGKTFLMQYLCNQLSHLSIRCVAPTGKASAKLSEKLPDHVECSTIHRFLYSPREQNMESYNALAARCKTDPDNKELSDRLKALKLQLSRQQIGFDFKGNDDTINLLIADEGSMIDANIIADLEKTDVPKILVVGDGGQLPAIGKQWFSLRQHDGVLNTIHRQALESPIIRMSMDIRTGNFSARDWKDGDAIVTSKHNVTHEQWTECDQILAGSNASRRRINRYVRKRIGYTNKLPMKGEKIICLKNNYRVNPNFINGVQAVATEDCEFTNGVQEYLSMLYEGHELSYVPVYPFHFLKNYDNDDDMIIDPLALRKGMEEFDFGYAITVHKAQGSEWDSVVIADTGFMKNRPNDRKLWLYTAVTRAKKKLIISQ